LKQVERGRAFGKKKRKKKEKGASFRFFFNPNNSITSSFIQKLKDLSQHSKRKNSFKLEDYSFLY